MELQQYLANLEGEFGRTGRPLHERLVRLIELKRERPEWAQALQGVEIPGAEEIGPAEQREHERLLAEYEELCGAQFGPNPWHGWVDPDPNGVPAENLVSLLRLSTIHLQRFWVEIQSYPVFLRASRNSLSVSDLERLFKWLEECPRWESRVSDPRLVPVLADPAKRQVIVDFVRNQRCVHALREALAGAVDASVARDPRAAQGAFARACAAAKFLSDSAPATRPELEPARAACAERLGALMRLREFGERAARELEIAPPARLSAIRALVRGAELVEKLPIEARSWRVPGVLDAANLKRLQAAVARAQELREARDTLRERFPNWKGAEGDSDVLRRAAELLSSGGVLGLISSERRAAIKTYRDLAGEGVKVDSKQMASHLLDLASFLEQRRRFQADAKLRHLCEGQFKGIDSELERALEAHAWATEARQAFVAGGTEYEQMLFHAADEKLAAWAGLPRDLPLDLEIDAEADLEGLEAAARAQLAALDELAEALESLEWLEEAPLSKLEEARETAEEAAFLMARIEGDTAARELLRGQYQGADTPLEAIEEAMAFIRFVQQSELDPEVKAGFIADGPQRLSESRMLTQQSRSALANVREHLSRIDQATGRQARLWSNRERLLDVPLGDLLARIAEILKVPQSAAPLMASLRAESKLRQAGLWDLVEAYRDQGPGGDLKGLSAAYELALNASVVQAAMRTGRI